MLKEHLEKILQEYSRAKASPLRGNSLAAFLRNEIPVTLTRVASLPTMYDVQGSPGRGNWAEIPWVGVFDKEITTTAERGYYVIYLFDAAMQGVYLSLNQGYVQYEQIYNAQGARGVYRELRGLVGKDILNFQNVLTEEERYQFESNEAEPIDLPEGPLPRREKNSTSASLVWRRDRRRARKAFLNAQYRCEINPEHQTFIMKSTGKQYVESHHLVPMEQQEEFQFDIDVPENIIAICPTCHRLLHLAVKEEKIQHLQMLYERRKSNLDRKGIAISFDRLMDYYL